MQNETAEGMEGKWKGEMKQKKKHREEMKWQVKKQKTEN